MIGIQAFSLMLFFFACASIISCFCGVCVCFVRVFLHGRVGCFLVRTNTFMVACMLWCARGGGGLRVSAFCDGARLVSAFVYFFIFFVVFCLFVCFE